MPTELDTFTKKWFVKTFEDDCGEESFLIQHLPDHRFQEIEEECTEHVVEGNFGDKTNPEPKPQLDSEKFNIAVFDHCLVDWKGFVRNGKPLKCTLENKCALLINKPDRAYWIVRTARMGAMFGDTWEDIKKKLLESLSTNGNGVETDQEQVANSA